MAYYSAKSDDFHKSHVGAVTAADDDDWDTDPNYVNDISEKEQRKGSKIQHAHMEEDSAAIDVNALKNQVVQEDASAARSTHSSMRHQYGAQ